MTAKRVLLFNPDHGNYMLAEVEAGNGGRIVYRGAWYLNRRAAVGGRLWTPTIQECRTLDELLSVFPRCRVEELSV